MTKYIFLDFDGVLNNSDFLDPDAPQGSGLSDAKLKILKEIVEKTDGNLILISDWRGCFTGTRGCVMQEYFTRKLADAGLELDGMAEYANTGLYRAGDVLLWLENHPCDAYIILDDDRLYYERCPEVSRHLVETVTGLTEEDVEKAVELMKLPVEFI